MNDAKPGRSAAILSTMEVARILGYTVRTVQLMVERGDLKAWKTPGGHRRIAYSSVQRYIERLGGAEMLRARKEKGPQRGRPSLTDSWQPPTANRRLRPVSEKIGRPCVLLIEDSAHTQNLIRLVMEEHFPLATLKVAADGFSGLSMFGELLPDVLVVDLMLPGMDGAALISTLKSSPLFRSTKVIVVTSLDSGEREKFAYALSGLPVIEKVNLVEGLVAEMTKALEIKPAIE